MTREEFAAQFVECANRWNLDARRANTYQVCFVVRGAAITVTDVEIARAKDTTDVERYVSQLIEDVQAGKRLS